MKRGFLLALACVGCQGIATPLGGGDAGGFARDSGTDGGTSTPGVDSGVANASAFVSQDVPSALVEGQTFHALVTMLNTGTATWTRAGTGANDGYFLGSQDPRDNLRWGTNRGWMALDASVPPGQAYAFDVALTAPADAGTYSVQWQMLQNDVEWFGQMTPATSIPVTAPALPPPPTREQIGAVHLTFQGMSVSLPDYGTIPWFEAALTSLSASDRQIVYAAKHAAGDTHLIVSLSWNYRGDGSYSYPVPGTDLSGNLPAFRALVEEGIENGFYVLAFLPGDGESNPDGGYNDPVGWTYGYSWLMQRLPDIVAALQQPTDLTPYVILMPGWDSVVPGGWAPNAADPTGSTYVYPSQFDEYLLEARSLVGDNGYLGVEIEAGACDWGAGASNYTSPAGQDLDIILQEFPGPPTGDEVWQMAARELGPAYVRPPDQPADDDPDPPWYLTGGTPRGPWFPIGFEYDEYRWVRGEVTAAQISQEKAYLLVIGYPSAD